MVTKASKALTAITQSLQSGRPPTSGKGAEDFAGRSEAWLAQEVCRAGVWPQLKLEGRRAASPSAGVAREGAKARPRALPAGKA
jgi:hypothetical protein